MPKRYQLMNKRNNAAYVPAVSYRKAKDSYFIFRGNLYPVADCSSAIFRDAILALMPTWRMNED